MDELSLIFQTAKECSALSSQMCRSFNPESMNATRKGDKTWVTDADKKIEETLRCLIAKKHPNHHILGEEEGGELGAGDDTYTWILDPIDGTFSFVHGIPFYSSLIAVLKGSTPLIGIAALPGIDIEMSAVKGQGVWINGEPYVRSKLVGSPHIEIIGTADPYRFHMESKETVLNTLSAPSYKCRTYPDALGYYLLLKGSLRAFVDPKVEIWDVAPFHVILPEAGFAIRPWSGPEGLRKGSSVAFPLSSNGRPIHCEDVLAILSDC